MARRKRGKPGPPKQYPILGLRVRYTKAQFQAWRSAARKAGSDLSAWVRDALDAAAGRV